MDDFNATATEQLGPDFIRAYNRIVRERHAEAINVHGNKLLMGIPMQRPPIAFGKRTTPFTEMCTCTWCQGQCPHPQPKGPIS